MLPFQRHKEKSTGYHSGFTIKSFPTVSAMDRHGTPMKDIVDVTRKRLLLTRRSIFGILGLLFLHSSCR